MTTKAPEPFLREDLPSSGTTPCEHRWVVVENDNAPEGHIMLVCNKCDESKFVKRPTIQESKKEKPLLMEKE